MPMITVEPVTLPPIAMPPVGVVIEVAFRRDDIGGLFDFDWALGTSVAKRRSTDNSHARLRGDTRGRDGGVREELAQFPIKHLLNFSLYFGVSLLLSNEFSRNVVARKPC